MSNDSVHPTFKPLLEAIAPKASVPSNQMSLESAIGCARAVQAQHPSEITDNEEASIVLWREVERLRAGIIKAAEDLRRCTTFRHNGRASSADIALERCADGVALVITGLECLSGETGA